MSAEDDMDKRVLENPRLAILLGWMIYLGVVAFYGGIGWAIMRSAEFHYLSLIIIGGVLSVITALWTYWAYGVQMIFPKVQP